MIVRRLGGIAGDAVDEIVVEKEKEEGSKKETTSNEPEVADTAWFCDLVL